jgi:hypothetical protein
VRVRQTLNGDISAEMSAGQHQRPVKSNDGRGGPRDSATSPHRVLVNDQNTTLVWSFRIAGGTVRWLWGKNGSPPIEQLEPIRKPWVSERSRHRPASAYSTVNGDHIDLESGEEHDLVRVLDREPTTKHFLPQPFRLTWRSHGRGSHTPDLLTVDRAGSVTVWDVRPTDEQDQEFLDAVTITQAACSAVGWHHQVFGGLGRARRLNLLWLNGFRRRPPWAASYEDQIRQLAINPGCRLSDLFGADDGTGELKSTVWHLIWRGVLAVDLNARIDDYTDVSWV